MKIATFNINSVNRRLPNLLAWLAEAAPDVVALQELKAPQDAFPAAAFAAAGYHAVWKGQRTWNGVAILARDRPELIRDRLPGDPSDDHSRYLEAAVNGVVVTSIYLPNGNPQPGPKFDYKMAWFARLLRHARKLQALTYPVVMAGDYNVVPTDADIYSPKSWRKDALLQPAPRAAYAKLLGQGWTDTLRRKFPNTPVFTFWDYFRDHWPREAGLRIDHILLNPVAAALFKDAGVDRDVRGAPGASDHAPVWVTLKKTKTPAKSRAKSSAKPKSKSKR